TEAQKNECYEAAKHAGHKSEECKSLWERTTTDPVALFTLVLALSTVGLWTATISLYRAGEKQRSLSERTAERQLRAYVHVVDVTLIHANDQYSPNFRITFQNFGQTPAYEMSNRCSCVLAVGAPRFDLPEEDVRRSDLGPGQDKVTTVIVAHAQWQEMKK